MKIIHVLPGDSLIETFKNSNIAGEIVICRECLIDGEIQSVNLDEFWKKRGKFVSDTYDEDNYQQNVAAEFEKLQNLDENTEVNLWFEYELYCQTNLWFCLFLLKRTKAQIYRVEPIVRNQIDIWSGFGRLEPKDLQHCFAKRIKITEENLAFGANLWDVYRARNFEELAELAKTKSDCFPQLEVVCKAEIEKSHRPQKILREIISNGETDFNKIFQEFSKLAGVYGFGDAQVKRIYDDLF